MERIQLSNVSFEGDNNVYLFDGPEPTLVDTGDWMTDTREHLQDGLDNHGLSFADIDRIFLTHWHGDHAGLAGAIQDAGGATIYVHEADAALVAGDEAAWEAVGDLHERRFEQWGMPEEGRETLRAIFDAGPDREGIEVTPITDGDRFELDGDSLRAVHAPGHAAGLCMYEYRTQVFSGDALLPKYTPNVGGADLRVERPLAQYLETLETIAERDYERAWPGHRDPIDDPTGRAREIIDHHRERAYRVLDALDRLAPADAWTVSDDLFGDLEHIHILHGPGEAHAHLEHLVRAGDVERVDDGYRLAPGVSDQLEGRDSWPLA